jgi:hypothetical protein
VTKKEAKILHGLYFDRQMVDEELVATGSEVLWLAKHSFSEGKGWRKEGKPQNLDKSQQEKTPCFRAVSAEQIGPLNYLKQQGSIELLQKSNMLFIRVTSQGIMRADWALDLAGSISDIKNMPQKGTNGALKVKISPVGSNATH